MRGSIRSGLAGAVALVLILISSETRGGPIVSLVPGSGVDLQHLLVGQDFTVAVDLSGPRFSVPNLFVIVDADDFVATDSIQAGAALADPTLFRSSFGVFGPHVQGVVASENVAFSAHWGKNATISPIGTIEPAAPSITAAGEFATIHFHALAAGRGAITFATATSFDAPETPSLGNSSLSFSVAVPEPSSLALMGPGLVGLIASIRRRRSGSAGVKSPNINPLGRELDDGSAAGIRYQAAAIVDTPGEHP